MRMNTCLRMITIAVSLLGIIPVKANTCLQGVNLSGAEFGPLPGRHSFDYAYPSAKDISHFAGLGMTALRLPFRWERLQPKLLSALDTAELRRLEECLDAISAAGMIAILDLHNFGHYNDQKIGSPDVPAAAFADVWQRLAQHFKNRRQLVFSIMNEPYDIQSHDWATAANAAIAAIRETGAHNFLIISGTAYSGAQTWTSDLPVGNNSRDMLAVTDPLNRFALDLHQYLDADFSGSKAECSSASRAVNAIESAGAWLQTNKRRGFLGEFAASERPECLAALKSIVSRINAYPIEWVGWTAWGAGAWWPPDYMFNLQPTAAGERPQVKTLVSFLKNAGGQMNACDLSEHH